MQSWHVAYGGGIDLHAQLTGHLGALLSVDYIAATSTFEGKWTYAYTSEFNGFSAEQAGSEEGSFEKGTSLLLLQLGISLTLP
ncbi:MAG: hypothetical protein KA175_09170 [Flavobacteriales bacterium]|nr:hypothetical protein [Flavobacteriales bacterium]MBP6697776.1 hypothetical protein [Flavobacteriales bacterium]